MREITKTEKIRNRQVAVDIDVKKRVNLKIL